MLDFEKYLSDFSSTINIVDFILNLILTCLLVYGLKVFYIKFGRAVSDRKNFANNFIPLALATMVIITVIKSSIALSLGLVGALSIVRFRAAIKDPEELTMLFLIIGFGLIGGANKPVLALISFIIILPILYFNNKSSRNSNSGTSKTFLNINTSIKSLNEITDIIEKNSDYVEIRRSDSTPEGTFVSYLIKINTPSQIDALSSHLREKDSSIKISFVDQPLVIS